VYIASDRSLTAFRFPVQWINRPNNPTNRDLHDFRGLSGQIAGGVVKVGDEVLVLPGNWRTKVKQIWTYDHAVQQAFCPQSVTLVLEDDLDISRGDTVVGLDDLPGMSSELQARLSWMHPKPLTPGRKFFLKHGTQTVQAIVSVLVSKVNIHTFEQEPQPTELVMNDIGEVRLRTAKPLVYDAYRANRLTGSFILIEQGTNATVGAGMLHPPSAAVRLESGGFSI
jgi:sulfate adenylyltransferase subunit 1